MVESLAEARRRAKKRVPRSVYDALMAGTERGVTLQDNMRAVLDPDVFISDRLPLAAYDEAIDRMRRGVGRKIQVLPGMSES